MITEYLGIPIFFNTTGYGNPIVFLHGFLETSKIWGPLAEEISTQRQVICVDLPGHGQTGNFGEIHTMELMAEVVHTVLRNLNISTATLMGHSMGGYVSLAFAEKFPHMTTGIVLLNSTPEADSEEKKIVRDRAAKLVNRNKKAFIKMAINNLVTPVHGIKFQTEIDQLMQEAFKLSKSGINAALMGMKIRTDRINVLRKLKSYKIMIIGEEDPIIPLEAAKNVSILSNCAIKIVGGGHLSYIESYSNVREIVYIIDYL